jgi:hypothetical protein
MAISATFIKTETLLELGTKNEVKKAVKKMFQLLEIDQDNIEIGIRPPDARPNMLVVTTEGDLSKNAKQIIRVPEKLFTFPFDMVLSLLTHEVHHVRQKTGNNPVTDKNEREFQAYYEGIFQEIFTTAPIAPTWLKKQFATHLYRYYAQMGENSELQAKYKSQKEHVDEFVKQIS